MPRQLSGYVAALNADLPLRAMFNLCVVSLITSQVGASHSLVNPHKAQMKGLTSEQKDNNKLTHLGLLKVTS